MGWSQGHRVFLNKNEKCNVCIKEESIVIWGKICYDIYTVQVLYLCCAICISILCMKEERGIAMQKKNLIHITPDMLVFALALIIRMVSATRASAGANLAPPNKRTPTPSGPTPTAAP